jgi:SAM-dependent methyltransferase
MDHQHLIQEQYGNDSLRDRIQGALRNAGLGEGELTWSDLVPLDQFHVRGLAATKELAEALKIEPVCELLDVGCGLGGAARYLTSTFRCHVTGIDLSQPFVEAAAMLSDRCGLTAHTTFKQADALELPFANGSFDIVWTQHVAMNIADRSRFYSEIHRVLKPGGQLAIYDLLAGDGRPLIFPVPWARRPEMSFLLNSEEMRKVVTKCGFEITLWRDETETGIVWFSELQARMRTAPPLGLPVVMGSEFPQMAQNVQRNLQEGRVKLIQVILKRV